MPYLHGTRTNNGSLSSKTHLKVAWASIDPIIFLVNGIFLTTAFQIKTAMQIGNHDFSELYKITLVPYIVTNDFI